MYIYIYIDLRNPIICINIPLANHHSSDVTVRSLQFCQKIYPVYHISTISLFYPILQPFLFVRPQILLLKSRFMMIICHLDVIFPFKPLHL